MRRSRVLIVIAASVVAVSACSGAAGSPAANSLAGPSGAEASTATAAFDQRFIDMMVPHHQAAVEMAELATERAEHPELRTLAADIISAQDREIEQLRTWRQAWFGSAETPPMDAMPMLPGMQMEGHSMGGTTTDMTADIDKLKDADPFDKAFIEGMIAHHESAIAAAKLAEGEASKAELRQLAGEIIAAQEREITEMKAWLEAWY